ncbi:rnf111 [Symbiodinium sp. CCMP2592]|nr:rnf111 [Symbiodinium sp. CCMP2592]
MHLFHVVGGESSHCQGRHCNIDRHLVLDKQCPVCKTPIDVMERSLKTRLNKDAERVGAL